MYNTILISLALDQGHYPVAIELAKKIKSEDGKIITAHVIDQVPNFSSYYLESRNEEEIYQAVKDKISERICEEKDIEVAVLTGHPGQTITDYAEQIGADCIIVGSHKPG